MMSVFAYYMIINLRAIKKHSAVEKDFSSMRSGRLPCKLFEYFQAQPAVNNAPKALPVRPNCTASLALFS